ncbi:PD40 domain-containing protein [Streptomyces sp. I05A-00742]|uniref:TolB family protein n=1 Tax=Streptomyces sp. I05A-00742 TaxID=2732853 RepID=UPI00148844F7|nr:PD40 domain-containing protein [Streptomyces sp. I05A-00742]
MATKRRTAAGALSAAALALAVTATTAPDAAARPHRLAVRLMSAAADGTPANDEVSAPAISADGRYVAYSTKAGNLVPGDTNGLEDVFVKDVRTGRITRIAAPERGPGIGARAVEPSLSADGRRLVFRSFVVKSNHNSPPDYSSHIHVVDLRTGRMEQADVGLTAPDGGSSRNPAIAADGRSVTFTSGRYLLSPLGDYIGRARLWKRDLVHRTSTLLAASPRAAIERGTFSRDGRRLVYEDLAGGVSGRWTSEIHTRDLRTGKDERLDVPYDGSDDQQHSSDPSVSPDGRYAQFTSRADNLLPGGTRGSDYVYLRDLRGGGLRRITAPGDDWSSHGEFAADGRLLAFAGGSQVYLRDLRTGRTRLVSVTPGGAPGNESSGKPAPSDRGDAVAFSSRATDLVPGVDGQYGQVYLRHMN